MTTPTPSVENVAASSSNRSLAAPNETAVRGHCNRFGTYLFSAPRQSMGLLLEQALAEHGTLAGWIDSFPTPPGTAERLRAGLLVQA